MVQNSSFSLEKFSYLLIFIAALSLRMGELGASALSENEAKEALRAYQLANGQSEVGGSFTSYVMATAISFSLIGSNEFVARFWPALAGSFFVLLPFSVRETLGRKAALVAALGLALSPGFLAVSRLADGAMLAMAFSAMAVLSWWQAASYVAGFLAVLAVLSGEHLIIGVLGLAASWGLLFLLDFDSRGKWLKKAWTSFASAGSPREFAIASAVSLTVIATLWLSVPAALSGLGVGLAAVFGFGSATERLPFAHLLLGFLGYGIPVLFFAIIGIVREWYRGNAVGQILSIWAAGSLLVAILNPGRAMSDLLWVLLPLWGIAGREIARYWRAVGEEKTNVVATMGLVFILGVFLWLNASGMARIDPEEGDFTLRLLINIGLIGLGGLALLLISYGWSRKVATNGFVWGAALLFALWVVSMDMRIVRLGSQSANELWLPGSAAGQIQLLEKSLSDISSWQTGIDRGLSVDYPKENASLAWALREWPETNEMEGGGLARIDDVILTIDMEAFSDQVEAYRGQDFVLSEQRAWNGLFPRNIVSWLVFRESDVQTASVSLWVRGDLFPAELEPPSLEDESGFNE